MKRILIVDDDVTFCLMLKSFLSRQNFEVYTAGNVNKALDTISETNFDLILTDYQMPQKNGMDLLQEIMKRGLKTPVVLMTSHGDIRLAVKTIKTGAHDYLTKPINPSELLELVKSILHKKDSPQSKNSQPKKTSGRFIEGISASWIRIKEEINTIAPTNYSVIIEGESGTGKEFVARKIHELSDRADKPFVAIDCGTLSHEIANSELFGHVKGSFTSSIADKTGQFELAHTGTLFLDEIGNLSYDIQIKLLRAIQERFIRKIGGVNDIAIDVRIIVATNENLNKAVIEGQFREDLYHRLNEFKINLVPIRERKEDIQLFAEFYLQQCNEELNKNILGFEESVIQLFQNYSWPGNLRELKNCVRRSALMAKGDLINTDSLPSEIKRTIVSDKIQITNTIDLKILSENLEKETIIQALNDARFNKSKAAKMLNIDRKTLYNKMKEYNL